MSEVPLTHHGSRNYPSSEHRVRECHNVPNLSETKTTFDKEDNRTQEWLATALKTSVKKAPRASLSVGEEAGPFIADYVKMQIVQPGSRVKYVDKSHTVDSRHHPEKDCAEGNAELVQ